MGYKYSNEISNIDGFHFQRVIFKMVRAALRLSDYNHRGIKRKVAKNTVVICEKFWYSEKEKEIV